MYALNTRVGAQIAGKEPALASKEKGRKHAPKHALALAIARKAFKKVPPPQKLGRVKLPPPQKMGKMKLRNQSVRKVPIKRNKCVLDIFLVVVS